MPVNFKNILILQIIALLFAMMNLSNIKIEYIADFLPLFDVMMIYYFTILRTGIFPVWFLFVMGLISDAINGFPLGITSLCYIITVKIFTNLRERILRKYTFEQIFGQFIAFAFCILILKWLMLSIYYFRIYSLIGPLIQLVVTSIFYIFMSRFFDYLDKKFLNA